jgi:hypothetical protein
MVRTQAFLTKTDTRLCSSNGYDEPEFLSSSIHQLYLTGADGGECEYKSRFSWSSKSTIFRNKPSCVRVMNSHVLSQLNCYTFS